MPARIFMTAALALAVTGMVAVATPASAAQVFDPDQVQMEGSWNHGRGHHKHWEHGRGHDRDYYRDGYSYRDRYYGDRYRQREVWRGHDGRYYCRRDDGTTGLVIGALLGGVVGNEVAGHGDRTLGTVIGAVGGGLLGRSIDRDGSRCR
jgi:opacity protein-like surface antigen